MILSYQFNYHFSTLDQFTFYSSTSTKQIIAMPYINEKDYDPLYTKKSYIRSWKNLCEVFTVSGLQDVGLDMINHFADGSGSTYSNTKLTNAAKNHINTKNFVTGTNKSFKTVIKLKNGNVAKLKYTHTTGVNRNKKYPLIAQMVKNKVGSIEFNNFEDNLNGLRFTIHQVYANQIEVVSYKYNSKTKKYMVKFKHTLYDHFGLDKIDIKKFGYMQGFRSWYILQHDKKFKGKNKPFITKIEFYETINGEI